MIDAVSHWFVIHADHAPLFIFGLLLLTGCSIPISEDLLVIVSGFLAATVLPEKIISLFFAAFLGSFFADCMAYWIGRGLGEKLSKISLFKKSFSQERRDMMGRFFQKYGLLALFIGRCIPFGVRNSVFMAAGAGKMPFSRFLIGDGIGCLLFSAAIFFAAFYCGENYASLHKFLASIGYVAFIITGMSGLGWYLWARFVRTSSEVHVESSQ